MALIKILQYPDPRLKRIAVPVIEFDENLHQTIDDMFETHYAQTSCAALAATQLDLSPAWRITVIDFSDHKNEPLCLINPYIQSYHGEHTELEGCMSVYPGLCYEKVTRAAQIELTAQDRWGKKFEMKAEGFMAKCIQHEVDHLDGKLYLDTLSSIKKQRLIKKIKKAQRI